MNKKGKLMANLSKLSKAFMLPIALLPIAGLFLGVGTTITGQFAKHSNFWWIGHVMQMTGNVPFQNLPALFAISVAIAYTKNAGVAGLTAFIAWLVFNVFISLYIRPGETEWKIVADFELNQTRFSNRGSGIVNMPTSEFKDFSFTMEDNGYLPPQTTIPVHKGGHAAQQVGYKNALSHILSAQFKTTIVPSDIFSIKAKSIEKVPLYYNLWFWKDSIGVTPSIVTPVLGIGENIRGTGVLGGSLNTGVFGGIAVGALVAVMYNKFYKIQLPKFISFFGGVRFVPIITFLTVLPLAAIFIVVWPGFGNLLTRFGKWTGTLPAGLDSFMFGLAKRALIPFGLHHVFYAPMWWSSAGGQLNDFISAGDVKLPTTLSAQGDQSGIMAVLADGKVKLQDVWDGGLHLGRFQSGEFAMMMFALPAVAVSMWLTVPKENRKAAMGIYFSAALTSFLTGITEPLEFTFLFVAPALYYMIHVPIFASSYMLANATGIKVGMTFSGGALDWIIFGIIPSLDGHDTKYWLVILEGLGYAALEGTIFYFVIKKFNIMIPGREKGEFKLFSKADFKAKTSSGGIPGGNRTLSIIKALGDEDNLENVDACATRLRVTVKDASLVDLDSLKSLGAVGVVKNNNAIQAIFGGEADIIKTNINEYLQSKPQVKYRKEMA